MRFLARGLCALIFITLFQTQLFAEYLYKDEVLHNSKFIYDIERLGAQLHKKTGISVKLIVLNALPKDETMNAYEDAVLKKYE